MENRRTMQANNSKQENLLNQFRQGLDLTLNLGHKTCNVQYGHTNPQIKKPQRFPAGAKSI